MLEHKIAQLEDRLLTARVITKKEISRTPSRSDRTSACATCRRTRPSSTTSSARPRPTRRENKLSNESPGRQGDHGPQEGRRRRGHRTARRLEVQDHGDQGGVGLDGSAPLNHVRDGRLTSRAWRSCGSAVIGSATRATCSRARFSDDPAWVWLIPDADKARTAAAVALPGRLRRHRRRRLRDGGPVLGAARWLPPGRPRDADRRDAEGARVDAVQARHGDGAVPRVRPRRRADARRRSPAAALVPRRDRRRPVGAAPGRRRGAAPARASSAAASAGLPAVLLTNNEANLHFYESHGFVVVRRGARRKTARGPGLWSEPP